MLIPMAIGTIFNVQGGYSLPSHERRVQRDIPLQHLIAVRHIPGGVEYQLGPLCIEIVIDLVRCIGWTMVIIMRTIEIENDGHTFARKIKMIRTEVYSFGIFWIVEFVIQFQFG